MLCSKCNHDIRPNNFQRHFNSCDGSGPRSKPVKNPGVKFSPGGWNKGLTKETSPSVAKAAETLKLRIARGEIAAPQSKWLPEHRANLSKSMLKAHAEGRAHNIGMCRWRKEPSYPEGWMISVIQNEFEDKEFVRERWERPYVIDFAWEHKFLALEIDGEQHDKPEAIIHDLKKDAYLREKGWRVLRVKWKDILSDKEGWIQKIKEFVHSPIA